MKNFVKAMGVLGAVMSIGATLISGWADEKKMDEKIKEKVDAALKEKEES